MQRACAVSCSAGQGFGSGSGQRKPSGKDKVKNKGQAPGVKSADSKAVQRAVRLVEEQEGKQQRGGGGGARPIDPREAAQGTVAYVKVKDWGSGAPEDLGSLQLESEAATQVFAADGSSPGQGIDSNSGESTEISGVGSGDGTPFHEVLARRLELLQSQGALGGIAQLPGGKPLPPFERWVFAARHYEEYLTDMYAVHAVLEESLASAADAEAADLAAMAALAAPGRQRHERLLAALELFGLEAGLARSVALLQDWRRLRAVGTQQPSCASGQQEQQELEHQQEGQQPGSGGGKGGHAASPAAATGHAAAYAAYIASLARLRGAAEGPDEEEQALLRLLAHAYILYLMHLTSGGRIAAAAQQRLGLAQTGALAFYSDYPRLAEGVRPLEHFVSAANRLGQLLSPDQQEALMQELAKAMTKTSMLLAPLAREA